MTGFIVGAELRSALDVAQVEAERFQTAWLSLDSVPPESVDLGLQLIDDARELADRLREAADRLFGIVPGLRRAAAGPVLRGDGAHGSPSVVDASRVVAAGPLTGVDGPAVPDGAA